VKVDRLYTGANIATMKDGEYNLIKNGAIGVTNGVIRFIGKANAATKLKAKQTIPLQGGVITPGLVDCHTHLIFGGNRAGEFEQRLNGVSYEEIAKSGGGIASSVKHTREATEQELVELAQPRLNALMEDGVTCVEIKSGYGLSTEHELKMLRAANKLIETNQVVGLTTCLAAHALPEEFKDDADGYIDYLCNDTLPKVAKSGLADAVDAFCEGIGFSVEQTRKYFEKAAELDLPIKLHAEQLSALGGSTLAAEFNALSADHLEYLSQDDVNAMAKSGTVAVLLPGAFYVLKETKLPPIQAMRDAGVKMAIATDINPGTSPVLSMRLMMNMACTSFGLTPEEALAGATIYGAKALGQDDELGSIEVGKRADFVHWNVSEPGELAYWVGGNLMKMRVVGGVVTHV